MTTSPKCTIVDTTHLQLGELVHVHLAVYIVTSAIELSYMLTVLCAENITIWLFPAESKRPPVRKVCFIITELKNEQHPFKPVRVDKDCALEKSTDVTNLLVDEFSTTMEITDGNVSCINVNNERHNIIIQTIVREGIIESN